MRLLVPDGNWIGPHRALSAGQAAEIRRLRRQGTRAREIAARYAISVRTVYRYLAEPEPRLVEVSGWRAGFVVAPGCVPRRVTAWTPA